MSVFFLHSKLFQHEFVFQNCSIVSSKVTNVFDLLPTGILLLNCRLKIFVPIAVLAFSVMVPVNWTNSTLERSNLTYSQIDKLSISNIPTGSNRYANFSTGRIVLAVYIFFI